MKFGVLVFPGSNCDHDTYNVIAEVAHQPVTFLWHDSEDLQGVDAVLVPGGFAYGDYLRTGAIARFSPVMQAVKRFAAGGGLVLGICNGFQILTEAGLAARRADAQRRAEVHLQAGSSARGNHR
jgi:phosphoribosylformylglycinamidine (FGAM) synthase-like amidotransferase family enzyme